MDNEHLPLAMNRGFVSSSNNLNREVDPIDIKVFSGVAMNGKIVNEGRLNL